MAGAGEYVQTPPQMSESAKSAPGTFDGIHAILYALFDEHEELDRAAMSRQVEICLTSGVHGIAALGLATEVSKLREAERRGVMDWAAEDNGGRVPLAFTIFGASVAEQVAQVRHAESVGADWLILQPPPVGTYAGSEYVRFFGRVADATNLPVAIQNAPGFLGRGLATAEIRDLVRQHPNVSMVKAEGPASEIAALVEGTDGLVSVYNGRGGLELIDNLRFGCRGMVLAPDCIDYSVRAYESYQRGDHTEAQATYEAMLPAAVFVMQGIEHLICYGKRLFCARAGISAHDRAPVMRPNKWGLALVDCVASALGPIRTSDE